MRKISSSELKGRLNKDEKKALRLLRKWHKSAERKRDFNGILEGSRN